jgi:REP-associated tyrosine transposase
LRVTGLQRHYQHMPRRPRVVIPAAPHHITQRGNNRQPVFFSPDDRLFYLDLLSRHAQRSGVRILGYCLMTNHVHLIAVPERDESLARALRHAHSEYSLALNRSERRSGHVWQNRYYSCPMSADRLLSALRYVELNPVRAGMAGAAWDWPWSSARAHTTAGTSDGVLCCDWIEYFGQWTYGEWTELLAAGSPNGECETLRRATQTGAPLGPPEFVAALERQTGRRLRVWKRGRPRKAPESPEERARQGCLFADSAG